MWKEESNKLMSRVNDLLSTISKVEKETNGLDGYEFIVVEEFDEHSIKNPMYRFIIMYGSQTHMFYVDIENETVYIEEGLEELIHPPVTFDSIMNKLSFGVVGDDADDTSGLNLNDVDVISKEFKFVRADSTIGITNSFVMTSFNESFISNHLSDAQVIASMIGRVPFMKAMFGYNVSESYVQGLNDFMKLASGTLMKVDVEVNNQGDFTIAGTRYTCPDGRTEEEMNDYIRSKWSSGWAVGIFPIEPEISEEDVVYSYYNQDPLVKKEVRNFLPDEETIIDLRMNDVITLLVDGSIEIKTDLGEIHVELV